MANVQLVKLLQRNFAYFRDLIGCMRTCRTWPLTFHRHTTSWSVSWPAVDRSGSSTTSWWGRCRPVVERDLSLKETAAKSRKKCAGKTPAVSSLLPNLQNRRKLQKKELKIQIIFIFFSSIFLCKFRKKCVSEDRTAFGSFHVLRLLQKSKLISRQL